MVAQDDLWRMFKGRKICRFGIDYTRQRLKALSAQLPDHQLGICPGILNNQKVKWRRRHLCSSM
jgi:hypothetical protein